MSHANRSSTSDPGSDIYESIKRHLPMLRRFARAISGSQESGDDLGAATLEAIIADPKRFDPALDPKLALFKVFMGVWSRTDKSFDAQHEDGLPLKAAAQRRMADIDPSARAAFLLGALEDFRDSEIADILSVDSDKAARLQKTALSEIEKQTTARILIIEDEPIIAMDLEAIVGELGHQSAGIADTKDDAVQMAERLRPDLILSDIRLADGSSGVDAARDILARFSVPIIFITAYPDQLLTGQRPEPTFLITKPFKRAAVQAAVSQALFFGTAEAIQL